MTTRKHIGHFFKVIQIRIDNHMNRRLQELELTAAQGRIIGYLAHAEGSVCARDLEHFFDLSHPTVSGLISRMEEKGFVEVLPDPKDRRVKRIVLLEKGCACSRQIGAGIRAHEDQMLRGFTQEERDQFQRYLERVLENITDHAESSVPKREE